MRKGTSLLVTFLLPAMAGLAAAAASERHPVPPDGMYLVVRDGGQADSLAPLADGEYLAVYTREFAGEADQGPPTYLVIHTRPEVHLVLAAAPRTSRDASGKTQLQFRLEEQYAAELEQFTRDHQGDRAAVFLGGKVVTVHKIRAVITGGRLQVSCCAPRACEFLRDRLTKARAVRR
jgi:preprotein translocase subunit SecD